MRVSIRKAALAAIGFSVVSVAATAGAGGVLASSCPPAGGVIVGHDYKHDTSPPLRDIFPVPPQREQESEVPPPKRPPALHRDAPDFTVQTSAAPDAMPSPILSFNGIPFPGVNCNCAPPD